MISRYRPDMRYQTLLSDFRIEEKQDAMAFRDGISEKHSFSIH